MASYIKTFGFFAFGMAVGWFAARLTLPPHNTSSLKADTEMTAPSLPTLWEEAEAVSIIQKSTDDHFWADAMLNGWPVKLMVDTGASTVALTYKDAQKIKLDIPDEAFEWEIGTAGGPTKAAFIQLERLEIGSIKLTDVDAMVLKEGLEDSLLGVNVLHALEGYEMRRNRLVLYQ